VKIVVDTKIPFIHGILEQYATVVYREGREISRTDLLDTDALIIRTRTKCNKALLEGTGVKFIASATIGFDHIDTAYCDGHKITWANAAGCNSSSVHQYIAAALSHLAETRGITLRGTTIGIVGVGNVGSKVERLSRALGMNVLLNDPPRERNEGAGAFVSLDAIVEEADVITFHVPLNREGTDKTIHMADERLFARLRKNQIIINSSRGEVVKTSALRLAINNRTIAACILDVWEHEPEIDLELLSLAAIGTPHIAGYSADGKANGTSMSVQALSRFFGLNLGSWVPANVPPPERPEFSIDCAGLSQQAVFGKLVRHTYEIMADDSRLRTSPGTFEKQRGDYPLRREFSAYTVTLPNAEAGTVALARAMGFTVLT
jgi:erythronate-4-phosphate dehydrogenase